jgi:hypothetical protein
MTDLRLEGTDGDWLLLVGPDGQTFRLVNDESLRRAVRREAISSDDSARISPREIQLEVRAGASIEAISQRTGATLEYVQKFAAPVIDELAHIVSSALSVRITIAGDRYSDTTQVEFGEVIATRLAAVGILQPEWTARKTDNGGWQVHCSYEDQVASWAFDPRKLVLSPDNELAIHLGNQQSLSDSPIPRLRPVEPSASNLIQNTAAAEPVGPTPHPASANSISSFEKPALATALPSGGSAQNTAAANHSDIPAGFTVTADLGKTAEFDGVVEFGRGGQPAPAPESAGTEDLTNTADLLDALRKRRLEREQTVLTTATSSIQTAPMPNPSSFESDLTTEFTADSNEDLAASPVEVELEATPEPEKPKARPGRTSMPSWDEIVFNTRSED